jgi:hypothetical protein
MPKEDMKEKNKICLYDFFEYLFSSDRDGFLQGVDLQMPYFIDKCFHMSNKYKALARLESSLFGYNVPNAERNLSHNTYENGKYSPIVPDTLFNVKFEDIINNPQGELNAYLIGMFKKLGFEKEVTIGDLVKLSQQK